ncbi:uncharacterized protein ASPGLDRAFT_705360 [Aspergillus glaucus CBS 516.65]|uniref:Uncharacterized protein n=1 Tax=Aspergillus glaucus CBS 516.65 TaxID=1160497 RepID=A0A1L9VWZ6_ASPGL|nr:hypothetical protein ASPGLDRAFT_705360 [Aspergillus glaucus CBS 516.65]OJJ88434.1 hypothetical protein ASPGLDRAFT_705360 [Aspergillus glaucus CBS 516.65]
MTSQSYAYRPHQTAMTHYSVLCIVIENSSRRAQSNGKPLEGPFRETSNNNPIEAMVTLGHCTRSLSRNTNHISECAFEWPKYFRISHVQKLRFADFSSAIIDKKDLYPDLISTLIENLNILVPRSIGPPTRRKRKRPGTAPWTGHLIHGRLPLLVL